jgi:hypothetical protein
MTVSSVRPRAAGALAVCLAGALMATSALAQSDEADSGDAAPTRLAPLDTGSGREGTGAAPSDTSGAADETTGGADAANGPDGGTDASPEGIEIDRLGRLDSDTIGILDPTTGGLGPEMWAETPRRAVERLLPRLPADLTSPALRDLTRRLLLSSSAAPRRQQTPDRDAPDLLHLRVERLMALGYHGEAAELLRVAPRRALTERLRRRHVAARLLAGEVAPACKAVDQAVAGSNAAYWQEALATCQIARGQRAQAELTVSLLRELGSGGPDFMAAFETVSTGAPLPDRPLSPLAHALLLQADAPIPESILDRADAGLCRAIAKHGPTALPRRTAAAELAVAGGTLPAAELRRLYNAFQFPDSLIAEARRLELVQAPPAAGWLSPTQRRALRYQAALRDRTASVRAELLNAVFTEAHAEVYPGVVQAFMPLMLAHGPRPDLVWFATTAGRALYAAGRPEAASDWLMLAREEAVITPEAAAALTDLWPYARFSGAAVVPINGGLAAWRESRRGKGSELALRESLLRASFEALNTRESRTWLAIAAESPGPSRRVPAAALVHALREAGDAGHRGEAVMLAVIGLGETGLAAVHPVMLGTALTALRQVGLTAEARRLAVEAALANGI